MPLSVPCPSCKRQYSLDEELYESKIAGHVVSFRCTECGARASIDGTKERPKALDENQKVAGSLSADDLGPDPAEIDEIDDEEVASLPPDSLKAIGSAAGSGDDKASLWVVNREEGADDEEMPQSELLGKIRSGKIPPDAIVWREGMADWLPVADVEVLAKHLPKARGAGDKTGGFLGTGMKADFSGRQGDKPRGESKSAPPPLPPKKKSSDPRSGKPVALSRGLLFSVDDDETRAREQRTPEPEKTEPKRFAPKPPLKSKPAVTRDLDFSDIGDEEPVPSSTGTPALKALTSKVPPVPEKKPKDDFLVSLGGGDEEVLGPPSIDISDLSKSAEEPAPESEPVSESKAPESGVPESDSAPSSTKKKKKKKKKKSKKKAGASRAPAATPSRRPKVSQPAEARQETAPAEAKSEEKSGSFWKVVLLAAIVGGIAFYVTRHKAAPPVEATTQTEPQGSEEKEETAVEPRPTAEPAKEPEAPGDVHARQAPKEQKEAKSTEAAPDRGKPAGAAAPAGQPKAPAETAATKSKEPAEKLAEKPVEKKQDKPKPATEKPASDAPPFNRDAAVAALNSAVSQASGCRQPGDPSGTARVVITFAPSGRVTSANLSGPPFAGTRTGGCIASTMRRARVPPFSGSHVTVSKSVVIH